MVIVCGVEEAGRGPVIGPMVLAGVIIDEQDEQQLIDIGVKDSKLLSPKQREDLYDKISMIAKNFFIVIISPEEIDDALNNPDMNLNLLEAKTSAKIINELRPDKAILDCPSNNINSYANDVKFSLLDKSTEIISEHKADVNYPVVSAASIIAKVTRDNEIKKLKEEYNVDIGSGYPSDPKTIEFLKDNYDKYTFFRKTWETYKRVANNKNQKKIGEF